MLASCSDECPTSLSPPSFPIVLHLILTPYILLNLFLSMLAAAQAPVILMSQNRQGVRDRLDAAHDYEVNLKAELEILRLHEKLDELREMKWSELITMQQEQLRLLTLLMKEHLSADGNHPATG